MAVSGNYDEHNDSGSNNNAPRSSARFKKRDILGYMFLPGIVPQIKYLFNGGFGYLALLIALIYQAVRILPENHPYTQYKNMGKFGIRQVLAVAANNVKFNKKNIDQVIIFFAIFAGIIILALQVLGFLLMLFTGNAFAQESAAATSIFQTQYPDSDIAFFMLREVFGLPDMFGTLEGAGEGSDGRSSLHIGLQTMFQFYNLAILIVAIVVFLYYIVVVVAETAQTGTPFGQRFSHIYAPIRLVIAIGLLVPLNYGFNGAQYVTFYAAKLGSGFATNGWIQFNNSLSESNPLGADNATLISETKKPDTDSLVEFMSIVTTCREAFYLNNVRNSGSGQYSTIYAMVKYDQPGYNYLPLSADTLTTLVDQNWGENIDIIFGHPDPSDSSETPESVDYVEACGEITIPINIPLQDTGEEFFKGQLQKNYYLQILALWNDTYLRELGKRFACRTHNGNNQAARAECDSIDREEPDAILKSEAISRSRIRFDNVIAQYYEAARQGTDASIAEEIKQRGWGGAGIWYNRIAEINGAYVVVVRNIPQPKLLPKVMRDVSEGRKGADSNVSSCEAYARSTSNDQVVPIPVTDEFYADTLDTAYRYWNCDRPRETNNYLLDFISGIFGLDGLVTIRDRVETGEVDEGGEPIYAEIHPLAKLSALGKGLVESAITSIGFGMGAAFGAGFFGQAGFAGLGGALQSFSAMFVSIATIGLSIGFITYYILPFLPFIYFFFAVGNWVKGIFEAMVGTPLWALAHLTIDGEGIPGKMALNGYLLILEIFLRPILTVFGLLGGMAIFTTLAAITNDIFDIVVRVGVGIDLQEDAESIISMHTIDVFFFTIVYAVILYMMATSSFKMINLVPNNIMRWLGNNVSAFSDNMPDPTGSLVQYAAIGSGKIGGDLAGGLTAGSQGIGSALGTPFGLAAKQGSG